MKRIALLCLFAAGCILPVSTGAPMSATTVGKGHIGGAVSGEAPTLDLIADNDNSSSTSAVSYGAAPAAAMTFTLSYGLGEDTDLEVAGEGALYFFIFPLPTGGSIGLRQHIDAGDSFDLGIAARIGQVGSSASVTTSDGSTTESSASATYGSLSAVIQSKHGMIRPLLAVNVMPARIKRAPSDEAPFNFKGLASSVTGGIMFVGRHALIGPYLTATNFYSDRFDNSGWFISGGIAFAIRPDRNRPPPPPPPAIYGPPVMDPMAPPPMAPPSGPPAPEAPPPPPPMGPVAPAPTVTPP
ncbi:MAG TPA: hypothetical protein VIV40_28755 [Kofleriaceae bacterium]